MALGDKCPKCGKRANRTSDDQDRWHHCPRCGITFNKHNQTLSALRDSRPGNALGERFKQKRRR
jgi:tRNA(Ile2) C34 agmatinyltransferase TiaS